MTTTLQEQEEEEEDEKEQKEQKEQKEEEEEQSKITDNHNNYTGDVFVKDEEKEQHDHDTTDEKKSKINDMNDGDDKCPRHDPPKWDMMCWAAWHGNEIIMRKLLRLVVGYYSSSHGNSRQLQEKQQQLDEQNQWPKQQQQQQESIVECLGIKTKRMKSSTTPLHLVARRGHLPLCWLLILCNENALDDIDEYGNTPLHTAAANGQANIVKCLLNYGSDWTMTNVYHFTPLQVAMNDEIRQILKEFAKDKSPEFSWSLRDKLQQEQRMKYDALEFEIKSELEKSLVLVSIRNDVETSDASSPVDNTMMRSAQIILDLQDKIEKAMIMGLSTCLINAAKKRMAWIKVAHKIYEYSYVIKHNNSLPTMTMSKLDEVNKFQTYLESLIDDDHHQKKRSTVRSSSTTSIGNSFIMTSSSSSTTVDKEDDEFPSEIAMLIDESNALCTRCITEYDLHSTCQSLMEIPCASESDQQSLDTMTLILEKAKEQGANKELLSKAYAIFCRLSSELRLTISSTNIPNVRLPVPHMSPKEEKLYWQPDDIGFLVAEENKVEETAAAAGQVESHESSSPPAYEDAAITSNKNFVWIKSAAYQRLENAIIQLESDINNAIECGGNQELITSAQSTLKDARLKLNVLHTKDETDRATTMAAIVKDAKTKRTKKKNMTTKKKKK